MGNSGRNQYHPDFVTPPGETLQDTLEALGMTQTELAQRIGKHKKTINAIVNGHQEITPRTARQLERALGVPASFWNNRQRRYDEYRIKVEEKEQRKMQQDWLKNFPLREMKKFKYISDTDDPVAAVENILRLLGVDSPNTFNVRLEGLAVQYRKSSTFKVSKFALAAWLSKGRELAGEIYCEPYDKIKFRRRLPEMRNLTVHLPEIFVPKLVEICAQCGVKVVFVPELPNMPVFGATYWIGNNPVIQLDIRGKKDDILWFTFFHEAAHVLLHGRKKAIYLDVDKREGDEEEEANLFASEFLVHRKDLESFVFTSKYLSKEKIVAFARRHGIAPGIVVGQMHHYGYAPYTHFQGLKRTLKWIN